MVIRVGDEFFVPLWRGPDGAGFPAGAQREGLSDATPATSYLVTVR
jgi:hypothetical protein